MAKWSLAHAERAAASLALALSLMLSRTTLTLSQLTQRCSASLRRTLHTAASLHHSVTSPLHTAGSRFTPRARSLSTMAAAATTKGTWATSIEKGQSGDNDSELELATVRLGSLSGDELTNAT